MKGYDNSNIRRQDRILEEDTAEKLLQQTEYGYLSMVTEEGEAYGIPVNFVYEKECIYIHCAPEGKKLYAIAEHPIVSFCVVGYTCVISNKFTTEYQSVVVKGKAFVVRNDVECMHALELILDKYSPKDKEVGMKYAANSFHRTAIIRIEIETVSGKAKII